MKTQANAKSGPNPASPTSERAGVLRSGAAKTFEHLYARRKIREQLRRLGVFNAKDEILA